MSKRLFSITLAIGIAIFLMVLPLDAAWAEKRVALVIGNSGYQTVAPLPNPARDANAVAKLFMDAKFDSVDVQLNLGIIEFKRTIRRFEETADQADIAVVYYAGHGLEINGTNYLIPVDAKLANDRDAEDEAVPLDRVLASGGGAKKLRLIILDACRDNPFKAGMRRDRRSASRGISTLGSMDLSSTTDTLTAYAAKLGSTAEDGEGDHSPFTKALLKNLTVPGLDVRMAFGRVKKEVMAATGGKQEPFVYGSLGDDNYALVPAPAVAPEPKTAEMAADYDLIMSINTRKAWEAYLTRYKTGPYADKARQQLASLSNQVPQQPEATSQGSFPTASVGPNVIAPGREPTTKEALDWDKIKESTDPAALQNFIKRYPDSPLALKAQQRIDVLKQAAQEREEKARAEREAAAKAAEQARIEAEQKKAEIAAARKREEDERRAKAEEAAQKAKEAEAEKAAVKQREEDERRAKAAEAEQKAKAAQAEKQRQDDERRAQAAAAEQKAKAAEAERKAADAKQKAEEAERTKAAAEAATARAESERQAHQAEIERKKAEQAAAQEAACKAEQGKFDELYAKGSDGSGLENMKALARSLSCDRLFPQVAAAIDKFTAEVAQRVAAAEAERKAAEAKQKAEKAEMICKTEQGRFDDLYAKGSDNGGLDNMKALAKIVTCDRLRPQVAATVDKFTAEAVKRAAAMPNSPQLVLAAQTELTRIGCVVPGKPDGILNANTKSALARYMKVKGRSSDDMPVTEALVSELSKQTDRVCPLECKADEIAKGDKCVAAEKPAVTSRREDDVPSRHKQQPEKPQQPEKRQAEREPQPRRPAPVAEPRARLEAVARPSMGGGGGGGGSHTMIGVGF
jgi:uncharacterized caspase-like protein